MYSFQPGATGLYTIMKNGGVPYAAAQSPVRSYGGQLRAPAATLRLRLLEVISSLPTAGMESSYAALLR